MFCRSSLLRAKDPFKVLGLNRTATKAEVKSKYRELAKKLHPDAESGDAKQMEEINRAYNLLLKEGAYERLHLRSSPGEQQGGVQNPLAGFRPRTHAPFSKEEVTAEAEDYSKVSALDPETERVTPEGEFLYQNRDTGEWIALKKPLLKAHQPRFRSFTADARAAADMQAEMRRRQEEITRSQNVKSSFDRAADRLADGANLPFRSRYSLFFSFVLVTVILINMYRRAFARNVHQDRRRMFYHELDTERARQEEMYRQHSEEVHVLIVAAALVMLAAAKEKQLSDPIVPPSPDGYYNAIRPPQNHFEVISGGG